MELVNSDRELRKLITKDTWFHLKDRAEEDEKTYLEKIHMGRRWKGKVRSGNKDEPCKDQPQSVMFIPRTKGGKLLLDLKAEEKSLANTGTKGYRKVKLAELAGTKLKNLLKSNPWTPEDCGRPTCTTCPGEVKDRGTCRLRNIVYQDSCTYCEKDEVSTCYIGETARTMPERYSEHLNDALNPKTNSHIREHLRDSHPEQLENLLDCLKMTVMKRCSSSLQRQVREAIEIGASSCHKLLNKKEEFNRCVLPVLRADGPLPIRIQMENDVRSAKGMT